MADKNVHRKIPESSSVALTAMALQDHWTRSLSLGTSFGPRKVGLGPAARATQKKRQNVRAVVDTGRYRARNLAPKETEAEKEYVLDEKPPPLTLAQKFGLVRAPKQLLSESEWSGVKAKSNERSDSGEPCVICKEEFGLQEQVILSCTHVFHKACLQAFERFTGRKTCPMCRHEQYQTRVIHEGARIYKQKSAALIQAHWRGYIVRCWYKKLRETVPPKDPLLKKKFYEEKLTAIVDRMINSLDVNMTDFLREIDSSVEQSRAVFSQWDAIHNPITPQMWDAIQLKAVERGDLDCPICLTELHLTGETHDPTTYAREDQQHSSPPSTKTSTQPATSNSRKPSRKAQDQKLFGTLCRDIGQRMNRTAACATERDTHNKTPSSLLPRDQESKNTDNNNTTHNSECYTNNNTPVKITPKRPAKTEKSMFVTQTIKEMEGATSTGRRRVRATVLLSCTHVFHSTCLRTLEEVAMVDMKNTCPVCRSHYQKKVITF